MSKFDKKDGKFGKQPYQILNASVIVKSDILKGIGRDIEGVRSYDFEHACAVFL